MSAFAKESDLPCKNCLQTLEEREKLMLENEELKRIVQVIKREKEEAMSRSNGVG